MQQPKIYADFQNADPKGRVRLNCQGTLRDLEKQQLQLEEGLAVNLYSDDADGMGTPDELRVAGVAQYSSEEGIWVAAIDWNAIHHASEETEAPSPLTLPKRHVG